MSIVSSTEESTKITSICLWSPNNQVSRWNEWRDLTQIPAEPPWCRIQRSCVILPQLPFHCTTWDFKTTMKAGTVSKLKKGKRVEWSEHQPGIRDSTLNPFFTTRCSCDVREDVLHVYDCFLSVRLCWFSLLTHRSVLVVSRQPKVTQQQVKLSYVSSQIRFNSR